MFDKFGEMGSYEEINMAAEGFFNEGDMESLRELAKENGIDEYYAELYIAGEIDVLCDSAVTAAIGKIEVECENLLQAKEALEADIDILMCDNMEIETIKNVVKMRNVMAPNVRLEASGNITLENVLEYAKSGVDAISTGAIIHQAVWVDLSMKIH